MDIATPEEVNQFLNTPSTQMGGIAPDEIASPEEAANWIKGVEREEKYGTIPQQLATGLEGAASAATFGLSTGLETALGVPEEDIAARREENPLSHTAGQIAGVVGTSAIPGLGGVSGAGKIMTGAGEAAAAALGLAQEATALTKIGSQAAKMAAENMLFQAGDEVSKMFTDNSPPGEAAQTALVNIGLSGIIGAGMGGSFGAVNPLWSATAGPKVEKILNGLKDKIDGLGSQMPEELSAAIQESGLGITPEVQAFLSGTPLAKQAGQTLEQSATKSGFKFQQQLEDLNEEAANKLVEAFGKQPEFIDRLKHLSDFETGANVVDRLHTNIKSKAEPIIEEFNNVRNQFKSIPIAEEKPVIAEKLAKMAEEEFGGFKTGDSYQYVLKKIQEASGVEDLNGLKLLQEQVNHEAYKKASIDPFTAGKVNSILREVEGDTLMKAAAMGGEESIARVKMARQQYGELAQELTELNQYLKLKKFRGPDQFLKALSESGEESILRKVTREDSVRLVEFMKSRFPEAAQDIRDYQINSLLKDAARGAKDNQVINATKLFKDIDAMSPEMREHLIGPEALKKIDAVRTIKQALPSKPMNTSGTAKTLDALWGKVPGTAVGALAFLNGSNPVMATIIGGLSSTLGRDIPDATRMALLKYIGTGGKIESGAFKSMVDYISNAIKGEARLSKATQGIFKSGAEVLSTKMIPDQTDRDKLDKRVQALRDSPQEMLAIGGNSGAYIPNQVAGVSGTATNAVNVLNSLRPSNPKNSPLDKDFPPTEAQKQKYNRALDIAEQPLIVLKDIKDGTLNHEDVSLLSQMYPDLYAKLQGKVMNDMNAAVDKGEVIPYNTRMGLSLFLGQPLDSTMTPAGISAIQQHNAVAPAQQQMQNAPKKSMNSLGKMPNQFQTVDQARVSRKLQN